MLIKLESLINMDKIEFLTRYCLACTKFSDKDRQKVISLLVTVLLSLPENANRKASTKGTAIINPFTSSIGMEAEG